MNNKQKVTNTEKKAQSNKQKVTIIVKMATCNRQRAKKKSKILK